MGLLIVFARPVPQGCNGAFPRSIQGDSSKGRDDAARQTGPATYAERLRHGQNNRPLIAGRY